MRAVGMRHDVHLLALQHKTRTHPADARREAETELGRLCRTVTIIDGTRATSGIGLALRALRLLAGTPLTVSVSDHVALRQVLRQAVAAERFDLAHFDTIGLGNYLPEIGDLPAVLSHHGAESCMMRRRVRLERNPAKKLLFLAEGRLLGRYESRHCPRFADNLVVSELDRSLLSEIAPGARFTVVPNGVDTAYFHAMPPNASHRVVFAGRLDQYSNRDAILHFAAHAWPGIRERFADATLDVLGMNPPPELVAMAGRDASIRVHGFVPDVRPYFAEAAVAVCPIRDGGGTRVKILDNLAMGKPIVSTSISVEGIDVVPGRDFLVADSPAEFVEQVARIFGDARLRKSLSENSRRLAEARYSWDGIGKVMISAFERAAGGPGTGLHPAGH